MELGEKYKEIKEFYAKRGMARRIGFGERPAILVVDFIKSFTDEAHPLGSNLKNELANTLKVLKEARRAKVSIIFTTVIHREDLKDMGIWAKKMEIPPDKRMVAGSPWVEVDPMLEPLPDEVIIAKKYASSFFGTDLISLLAFQRIDTLIVTGCTTSGCVRATVVDSLQYGFRTIVPLECVGDRAIAPHEANLFDMDSKYADVVPVEEVLKYLSKFPDAA